MGAVQLGIPAPLQQSQRLRIFDLSPASRPRRRTAPNQGVFHYTHPVAGARPRLGTVRLDQLNGGFFAIGEVVSGAPSAAGWRRTPGAWQTNPIDLPARSNDSVLLLLVFGAVMVVGAGKFSIDGLLLSRKWLPSWARCLAASRTCNDSSKMAY